MKQLQKKLKSGSIEVKEDDAFELFIAATEIRYCYYSETHKILGSTYGMCVLQVCGAMIRAMIAWLAMQIVLKCYCRILKP